MEDNNNEVSDFHNGEMFPLRNAVVHNNLPEIRRLLAAGADPNQRTRAGTTALGVAVVRGNVPIVRLLLEKGANPNTGTPDTLPLTVAINNEDLETLELLLAANADVYRIDPYTDESPLEYVDTVERVGGGPMHTLLHSHLNRRRRLMEQARNIRALNIAMGKHHGNYLKSVDSNVVGRIGEFISGSTRRTLKNTLANLKRKAMPTPRQRYRRNHRHTRRARS